MPRPPAMPLLAAAAVAVAAAAVSVERAGPVGALLPGSAAAAGPRAPEVRVLTVDGVISPPAARYLERGIREAAAARAEVVVLRLNTPGGLESSMRRMVEAILNSPVPVVVYVAPPGGRAASAGMFLTLAGHVAAMAPATNIGAAHPVTLGGEQPDTTMAEKVVSDAAAFARALAERRGRNAEWAELAVRRSASLSAEEAREEGVIDLVADDPGDLLAALHGRRVETAAGPVVLRTAGARVVERPMGLPDRILHVITNPNLAYLLLTIGVIGIIAELYSPGAIFPGVVGAIALVTAFVGLGSLPVNWAGVALIVLGVGLFVADLASGGLGLLAVGGLIAFVIGSLMLYSPLTPPSPAMPAVRVSPWLVGVTAAGMAAFVALIGRALLRTRRAPVVTGAAALVGRTGVVLSPLAPRGRVRVDSEVWTAEPAEAGAAAGPGETVEVVAVEGVTLKVRRREGKPEPPAGEV